MLHVSINWQVFYYFLGALSLMVAGAYAGIKLGVHVVSFFVRMDTKLDAVDVKVDTIMTNHLPHIYERLGERFEVTKDSISYSRGNRLDRKDERSDP